MNFNLSCPKPRGVPAKLLFVVLFALLFAVPGLQAQNNQIVSSSSSQVEEGTKQYGFARIDSEKRIWLDPSQPVHSLYKVDMSHLGFSSIANAESFFTAYSSATVSFSVLDVNTLRVQLSPTATQQTWSARDWNQLLETKAIALKTSTK